MALSVRPDILRVYKVVHTWVGIVAGLALFIAFYAGALTMYKEPLARWASPDRQTVSWDAARVDRLISETLAIRPDVARQFTVHLRGIEDDAGLQLTWRKDREDPAPWSARLTGNDRDPVRMAQLHPSHLAQFIDTIHRTAGIPGDREIGSTVMGGISILYALALVSGVVVLLPSLIKDFFALRIGRNLKRMWLDVHNLLGIVSLPFHLVIALTAVVFGLHDVIYDTLDKVVYEGKLHAIMRASNPMMAAKPDPRPAPMLPVADLLGRVTAIAPGFTPVELEFRNAGTLGASVRIWGRDPSALTRGRAFAVLDPVNGRILDRDYLPGHQGNWSATVAAFFALHFGSFGGETVRFCYFLLGLSGAVLFYTGNLLWVETRRKTERRSGGPVRQSRSTRMMGAATVGVCLGCVCGLSLSLVTGRCLAGGDKAGWLWLMEASYYLVFVACVSWAFRRGAARAGWELCLLAATLALTVPVISLIRGGTAVVGVDLTAAVAAAGFVWMAMAGRRRAMTGPRDSVWAVGERT